MDGHPVIIRLISIVVPASYGTVLALAVMWRIHAFAPQLATTLDAYLRAASPEQAADAADVPLGMVTTYMMMGMAALWGFVRLAVHGWIAWRVRRPDVRALLAATGREGN